MSDIVPIKPIKVLRNSTGNVIYEKRIVVFLDILGFASKISTESGIKIKSMLDDLYKFIEIIRDESFNSVRISTFSDNVVISVKSNKIRMSDIINL